MLDNAFKPFSGTVEELLDHVGDNIDPAAVESLIDGTSEETFTDSEAVNYLMAELNVDKEVASDILHDIKLEEIDRIMLKLCEDGLVNIIYGNSEKVPMYSLTDNGKILLGNMK